jgi:hypothetical protein
MSCFRAGPNPPVLLGKGIVVDRVVQSVFAGIGGHKAK